MSFRGGGMIKVPAWPAGEPECDLQNPLEKKQQNQKSIWA